MNSIASFRLCTLSDDELCKKVDEMTDNIYKTSKIPDRNIPAKPNQDYDLLIGELLVRFDEKISPISELKEVSFKKWIPIQFNEANNARIIGTGKYSDIWSKGYFHKWAENYEEFETTVGRYPVGLIEDAKGFIHEIHPTNIQFIK